MNSNRRDIIALTLLGTFFSSEVFAQKIDANAVLKALSKSKTLKLPNGVTNADANAGLKEALVNGAVAAVLKLGKLDGYWADNQVKIPLPKPFSSLQKNLKAIGMSGQFDDLQLKINRAAETAAPKAKDIFVGAISSLTIEDVAGILKGGETAATDLLKTKTKPALITEFSPAVMGAVEETGAGKALDKVSNTYNKQLGKLGGLSNIGAQAGTETKGKDFKTQFTDYAVSKALDGLFYYVGREEAAIRKDPMKRTSELLKKVFGG